MNDFILEILDPTKNILEVETSFGTVVNNIQIEIFDESTITISSNEPIIQLANITDLSVDARNFLLTPSSSGLRILVTDETGSGNLVFSNSPNFSGIPTVPTAANGTNTNQIASTAFVRTEINNNTSSNLLIASVSGLQVALDGKQPSGNYAPLSHIHTINDVSGLQTALDSKQPSGNYALSSHTHTSGNFNILSVSGVPVSISGHTHSTNDITSGIMSPSRLGSGATSTTFLRGDSAYVALVEVYEFTRTTKPAAATGSSGSYTFTIPAEAKTVEFFAIGAGGGGGSGRRGAAGTARFGGGGGGSGGVMILTRSVAELASRTVSIGLGAGGAGGAAVTANDTNGNPGTNGVDTTLVISGVTLFASRGGFGSGGTAAAGSGGSGGAALFSGTAGSSSSATAAPNGSNVLTNAGFSAGGGGAGGGISTGDVSYGGAIGRAQGWYAGGQNTNSSGGTAPGGNGQNASDVFTQVLGSQPGGAGAGGAAGNASTAGGNGGNGADYGGAGGGGGASVNGFPSGAGGNGGDGFVRITVWY